mmetsp:Transcript_22604/g.41638  ORF Transcript_22604/g.41638 Transcript_22604/m.41638 type:complete len:224 (+) Transcript_22604:69-740(+)
MAVPQLYGAAAIVGLIAVCLYYVWPVLVTGAINMGDFKHVRAFLLVGLALQWLVEITLWSNSYVKHWMLMPILVTNFWGLLDAVLRYPIVHSLDDVFYVKQASVLGARILLYTLGINNIARNLGWYFLWQFCGVLTLPLLWATALPVFDERCQHMKHNVIDEDILVRLWSVTSPTKRKQMLIQGRIWSVKTAVNLARLVPPLKRAILTLDPSLARTLRDKQGV